PRRSGCGPPWSARRHEPETGGWTRRRGRCAWWGDRHTTPRRRAVGSEVDQVAGQLADVERAETALRGLLDEILAARRALDRRLAGRLDELLPGPADRALQILDGLSAVDVAVLLAAMVARQRDRVEAVTR